MEKRIISMGLAIVMIVTIGPVYAISDNWQSRSAEHSLEESVKVERLGTDTAESDENAMEQTAVLQSNEGVVEYPVTGGNIYFNTSTGAITDCDSTVTEAIIPSTINGIVVKSIHSYAFNACVELMSVTISDCVTSIGAGAFSGCTKLERMTIPNSVTSVSNSTFSGCVGLESVTIPDSVMSIGSCAFMECTSLKSVTLPNCATSIKDFAFFRCTSLTNVTIPNDVTSIGSCAFGECKSLKSVIIPAGVTSIGNLAFSQCKRLMAINVVGDNSAYSSADGVLFDKSMTKLIQYPSGSTYTKYVIPSSVTSVSDYAFYYCYNMTNITIPESVTSIGKYAFYCCTSLVSVVIPSNVTRIGEDAFYNCESLVNVTIPNGVTNIGDYAFGSCTSLTCVIIPNSVSSIGSYAFAYCNSLKDVNYLGSKEQWEQIDIRSNNDPLLNATIHFDESILGDMNGDGKVNVMDLIRLKKCVADGTSEITKNMDINGDGNVDVMDLISLKKIIAGA